MLSSGSSSEEVIIGILGDSGNPLKGIINYSYKLRALKLKKHRIKEEALKLMEEALKLKKEADKLMKEADKLPNTGGRLIHILNSLVEIDLIETFMKQDWKKFEAELLDDDESKLKLFLDARHFVCESVYQATETYRFLSDPNLDQEELDTVEHDYKSAFKVYSNLRSAFHNFLESDEIWRQALLQACKVTSLYRSRQSIDAINFQHELFRNQNAYGMMVSIDEKMCSMLEKEIEKDAANKEFSDSERDLAAMLLNTVKPSDPTVKKILKKIAGSWRTRKFVRGVRSRLSRKKASNLDARMGWRSRGTHKITITTPNMRVGTGGGYNRRTKKRKSRCRMTKRRIAKRRMTKRKKSKKKRTKHKRTKRR